MSDRIKQHSIGSFDLLPENSYVPIRYPCELSNRSPASVWRDVAKGKLPRPIKIGNSTRWRVGDLRIWLTDPTNYRTPAKGGK